MCGSEMLQAFGAARGGGGKAGIAHPKRPAYRKRDRATPDTPEEKRNRMKRKIVIAIAASALLLSQLAPTASAYEDPALYDFGREGAEVGGQPRCYLDAPDETLDKTFNLNRPACRPVIGR